MKRIVTGVALAVTIAATVTAAEPKLADAPPPPPGFPKFKVQEIATDFKIGYAVHIADVNGDDKPDIVVVDKERVVWYENPTWKVRTITQGKTKPDNVCICSLDIDGDKKVDFVLGAGWKPFDTKTPGTLQWLRRGKSLDDEWEMFPIPCDEPMVHRVKADYSGGLWHGFVMAPLMGRDSTKAKNWMDGKPVRVMKYPIPKSPTKPEQWKPQVVHEELHVIHNFNLGINNCCYQEEDIYASYDGLHGLWYRDDKETLRALSEGNQSNPKQSRGASEIHQDEHSLCSIEPWHGNEVVYYRSKDPTVHHSRAQFNRVLVDNHLRWGHAVKFADLLSIRDTMPINDFTPFIVAGVRDNPDPKQGDKFTEKRGVRLYRATDAKGEKWERYILEDGGVAVEDLAVHDLNNDGKPDIIAVGRATQNCRIYWNQGK